MARQLIMENNDKSYMTGDASEIKRIFNNIVGNNIQGEEHIIYLNKMKKETGLKQGTIKVYYKTLLLEGIVN